jgi:hypothetical protein
MKKLVFAAGLLLLLSVVFPNGPRLPSVNPPVTRPVEPAAPVDAEIVRLLAGSPAADRARIYDVYTSLKTVLRRPTAPARITTTEKWEELHGHTLELAIEQVNKYPGLDAAIERVFATTVGTDDVMPGTPDTLRKLGEACDIIASSVATAK